jgi:electron transfer flavoprotein beta subunit
LHVIVLIKQICDTGTQVEINADGTGFEMEDVKWSINPYDEFALEEALRIKEKFENVKVTAMSVGPERVREAIRTAYAMGVDEAIHIDDETADGVFGAVDPVTTARILTAVLNGLSFDLIIAGQRAVDDDSYQVPAFVAEMLDLPMISMVVKEEIVDGRIYCEQALDSGMLVLESPLPVLMTTQKGLNEPRYPAFRAIMKAKKRDVDGRKMSDLGLEPNAVGDAGAKLKIRSLCYPQTRDGGHIIQGETAAAKAVELVRLLKEEAQVL